MKNEKLLINNLKSNNSKNIRNKKIDEIVKVIEMTDKNKMRSHCDLPSPEEYANDLYNAGYRKQIDGEWRRDKNARTCSECRFQYWARAGFFGYCPNCGAKMKGGKE